MYEAEIVLRHAGQLLTVPPSAAGGAPDDVGLIEDGALAIAEGHILWVGPTEQLERHVKVTGDTGQYDLHGRVVTPGLVDPHTHLVFAGTREREFASRAAGRPYLEILAEGGGILSTVRATRAATEDELVRLALPRLQRFLTYGVTTIEAKSGYGLSLEHELKILRATYRVGELHPVRIVPTFLGAHAVPPEFRGRKGDYVRHLVDEVLPAVAGERLAEFCDIFLDDGVFSLADAKKVLGRAKELGLRPRMHAGQFKDLGGPQLAGRLGASSADHLECVSEAGIRAMAKGNVVAVLLPGAALSLGQTPPDARRFTQAGVRVALATDLNPGTSMTENLLLMTTLGIAQLKLTPEQALRAVTDHAAAALGRSGRVGTLAIGAAADVAVFDVGDWRRLAYHFGVPHAEMVMIEGEVVWTRDRIRKVAARRGSRKG
ncbi:MAG: imidazolonepropionase [Deltaproteobacteria bacterium]|nr:imidazolonepropionase [Deltaproteobacteria bacterium]